jgi:hypothetical protein
MLFKVKITLSPINRPDAHVILTVATDGVVVSKTIIFIKYASLDRRMTVKKFVRNEPNHALSNDVTIDFGAAADRIPRTFEPGFYDLQIQSADVIKNNDNTLILLEVVEMQSGNRVATSPIWIDGPKAHVGQLAAENRLLIAKLLHSAGQPTAGKVSELISRLVGAIFEAHLVERVDNRTGRTLNVIMDVVTSGGS